MGQSLLGIQYTVKYQDCFLPQPFYNLYSKLRLRSLQYAINTFCSNLPKIMKQKHEICQSKTEKIRNLPSHKKNAMFWQSCRHRPTQSFSHCVQIADSTQHTHKHLSVYLYLPHIHEHVQFRGFLPLRLWFYVALCLDISQHLYPCLVTEIANYLSLDLNFACGPQNSCRTRHYLDQLYNNFKVCLLSA